MAARHWIRVLLAVLVYGTVISIGAALFVSDLTDPLVVAPVGAGLGLIAHAVRTARLGELGYAVAGMWAAVLALSAGVGVVEVFALSGRSEPRYPSNGSSASYPTASTTASTTSSMPSPVSMLM